MSERKHQILQSGLQLITSEGYGAFSMRAVARRSGLTLGALQYHYRTREDLLRALATHITHTYRSAFDARTEPPTLQGVVAFVLEDIPGEGLQADRLFPQLWAMALVEPIMDELLYNLYAEYLDLLEGLLTERGEPAPRAEALVIMGLLEGQTFFVGRGRRWADHGPAALKAVHALIVARYGDGSCA